MASTNLFGQEVELRKLYAVSLPTDDELTPTGIVEIKNLLWRNKIQLDFPADWQWRWLVKGKGDYVGTLPKRIANLAFKTQKLKIASLILAEIGNLASTYQVSTEARAYHFDLTDAFTWQDGDFGDEGSCFWGGNSGARDIMEEAHFLAFRLWQPDDITQPRSVFGDPYRRESKARHVVDTAVYRGLARCWFAPNHPVDGAAIIFNGYGIKGRGLLDMARILSTHFGLSYKHIALSNQERESGLLYINSGGGYVIGTSEAVGQHDAYDFNLDDGEEHYHCADCGCEIDEDDHYHNPNDDDLCYRCYDRTCFYCEHCHEEGWIEDHTMIQNEVICQSCFMDDAFRCERCDENEWATNSRTVQDADGNAADWCMDCANDHAFRCDGCKDWFSEDRRTIVREIERGIARPYAYCPDCAEEERQAAEEKRAAQVLAFAREHIHSSDEDKALSFEDYERQRDDLSA